MLNPDYLDATEEIVTADSTEDDEDEDDEDDDLIEDEDVDVEDTPSLPAPQAPLSLPINHLGSQDVIAQLIDIREPLFNLRKMLEKKIKMNLRQYDFWLQDSQLLPENTTLVEQCVQGEGLVQINVEIKTDENGANKINIVDVLKPPDDMAESSAIMAPDLGSPPNASMEEEPESTVGGIVGNNTSSPEKSGSGQDSITKWVVCATFRKEQERLNIPTDPLLWERAHVSHWIAWTIKEFPNAAIDITDWDIEGKELCAMSHDDFKAKVPVDPSDLMWTHLELLRKCKFVAVVQTDNEVRVKPASVNAPHVEEEFPATAARSPSAISSVSLGGGLGSGIGGASMGLPPLESRKTNKKPPVRLGAAKFTVMSESALGNRTGNNGQVQLWQFLLELLTEKDHREVIHWIGDDGEFKLENPEVVAQLWGTRKNKPSMNYEKLSRALRYYYDGDMISKVHGKRFVYKFVCDLKQLLGYSAYELNQLVIQAEQRANGKMRLI